MAVAAKPTRLALGRTPRRFPFERRVFLWLVALALPAVLGAAVTTFLLTRSAVTAALCAVALALLYVLLARPFVAMFTRPLNTLTSVVAGLREDDFSFRARGARRGDAMGDLALEINLLASTLQGRQLAAQDALVLVDRVLIAMPSPVLAFGPDRSLRLLNAAAMEQFALSQKAVGVSADKLGLASLLDVADQGVFAASEGNTRWSVRRATFRLYGVPHALFVLSDVAAALRLEERTAWQRLIRVLSHEINNSLTPIQSIAGSLRARVAALETTGWNSEALLRGLAIIEDRSVSLNRFLTGYQQLSRLPEPTLTRVPVERLVAAVVPLETRLECAVLPGPYAAVLCDSAQIEQALINLLRNAADAALAQTERAPAVSLGWSTTATHLRLTVTDNGLGVANPANLFVPFYTTKPHGLGIGLVLAQQIANAHTGFVELAAPDNGEPGCSAVLTLPLETQAARA